MLDESQLNVYIIGDKLTPRQRQRLQAQLQTALRALPEWAFALLRRRLRELGLPNAPLIVEPHSEPDAAGRPLGLGEIDGRPAARLTPLLRDEEIDWRQDQRYLLAKAVAYVAAPPPGDGDFWGRWSRAVAADRLKEQATAAAEHWAGASDRDLLIEMFAAAAINPSHRRWASLPEVGRFLERWRAPAQG